MSAKNLNTEQFRDTMKQEGLVLVDFWAPWCPYCRRISSVYDAVADQNAGKITVAKVDTDQEPEIATQENIEVLPTLVLYRDGKALGSIVAPASKAAIDAFIETTLSK